MKTRGLVTSTLLLAALLASPEARAQTGNPADVARAQALFDQAVEEMKRRDYPSACPKLEEVVRLAPDGVGARIQLGECYEGSGRLASAWATYTRAEGVAAQTKNEERRAQAAEHAARIKPRLATLTITVSELARGVTGIEVKSDGAAVGQAEWGVAVPVDKGKRVISATAPGRQRWERTVEITSDGAATTVTVDMLLADITSQPAGDSLAHRFQPGLLARLDIDPINAGARAAVGLTFGLWDHLEIGASALIGSTMGVEPQLTGYIFRGRWKPLVNVGVPIFFSSGAQPGVRGAAGVQWDLNRHFGVFAQVGGAYFPGARAGYAKAVFLPALGVQGRI